MKKAPIYINRILNIIIGSFIGVFIGHSVYIILDFKDKPDLYAAQSAPWYTGIITYGIFTAIILLIAFTIKIIINHKHFKD